MIQIRNIEIADIENYWQLRLQALKTSPEAFSASYEESILLSKEEVEQRHKNKTDNFILGAFTQDGHLIGMTGFLREQKIKLKHKGTIWGVYVASEYRGNGIAKALLTEVLNRGRVLDGLNQINLSVVSTNRAAAELYRSLGFETYGFEKNALVVDDREYDEEYMVYTYVKEQEVQG
ncbi:GNAT family N-acetyltransferase [Paenibacillus sedimenti]|uniref:GNAT family N-acetyltransferase n=1 Tax=Paenibacillus sedimenti TaxID=2770274 RepID=A0A926KTG0_9BACL|nr:GNAT family N-acetyltransferase [Paenibacillus sedimenti]MBD0382998.1 GNAT family N-acetyltransferase [Paenibacillus sedimenti]